MSAEVLQTAAAEAVSTGHDLQTANPVKKVPSAAQRKKRKRQRNALLRAVIQTVFFVTMPGAFMAQPEMCWNSTAL